MEQNEIKNDWLARTRLMIGNEAVERLRRSTVMVFGVGGVGGAAVESLVRAGIGHLVLVDNDTVSESNINRQLIADTTTVGQLKTEVCASRCLRINPDLAIVCRPVFATPENIPTLIEDAHPDYIIDAIDTVTSKLSIIRTAKERSIPIISSMGTGSKLDPTRFVITDISKTHTCPLAKVIRLKLRESGITHLDVLFSDELPIKATIPDGSRHAPGSISFVPPAAGFIIGGYVIKKLACVE